MSGLNLNLNLNFDLNFARDLFTGGMRNENAPVFAVGRGQIMWDLYGE